MVSPCSRHGLGRRQGHGPIAAMRAVSAVETSVAEETITSILGAVLTILCGCGAEDKRKATGRILPYGILQVESLKRNMDTRSVRGDVSERSVGNPVVGCGVTTSAVHPREAHPATRT